MQHDPDTLATASTASTSSGDGQQLKIFINYRKATTGIAAAALYQALEPRFGKENVFLDVVTLDRAPGGSTRSRSTAPAPGRSLS